MSYSHYERLSALDATFLDIEGRSSHMHVGSVAIFEAGPLRRPDGGLDIEGLRALVDGTLHHMPRFRQRLAWIPVTGHPVWVDDPSFNLSYHLRHVSLPRPGDERLLKRLAGHVLAQQLDRGKPLWELWVVEGLEGDRFAIVMKAHHCMLDGIATARMMASAMAASPDSSVPASPPWLPRPAPGAGDLLLGELLRGARSGVAGLQGVARSVTRPVRSLGALWDAARGVGEAVSAGFTPASATPLNVDIGPHRRFDWLRFELADVKEVKNRLGGTLNDVVLATVSGALGRFLHNRGESVDQLDFRAMLPVNLRTARDARTLGNRVSMMVARLPVGERDPRRRLQLVTETTRQLKAGGQSRGVEALAELSDSFLGPLFTAFARFTAKSRPYNVVITNIPGPQARGHLLGAPLVEVYPLVPLFDNQALGVALFSYDGGLYWGFNSDWDAVPDLHALVEALVEDFEQLRKAAVQDTHVPR